MQTEGPAAPGMKSGGGTPEELDTLLEDAFVLRDGQAMAALFQDPGLLYSGTGVLGVEALVAEANEVWEQFGPYFGSPRRIYASGDTALLVGGGVIHVATRGSDRSWRLAISLAGRPSLHAAQGT